MPLIDPKYAEKLFKSAGVLWRVRFNRHGEEYIDSPLCPTEHCHTLLDRTSSTELTCLNCGKKTNLPKDYEGARQDIQKKFEGHLTHHYPIYSLDLPPTKVVDANEDDRYWVQARISEKNGKRMAVIYFGERVADQSKKDYVQTFVDFEDEQLRFDKSNKNPMKLLARIQAEFPESEIIVKKK